MIFLKGAASGLIERPTDLLAPKNSKQCPQNGWLSKWQRWHVHSLSSSNSNPHLCAPPASRLLWITERHNRMIDTWEAKSLSTTSNNKSIQQQVLQYSSLVGNNLGFGPVLHLAGLCILSAQTSTNYRM